MPGEVIGNVDEPRTDNGQPGVALETLCAHCGRSSVVNFSWEEARQYVATFEARLAENMRKLPHQPLVVA